MRKLIEKFVKYPFYANIIIAILLGAGLASIFSMKKSFFPETTPKYINVSVAYPGASPKEMEEGVTIKIEEALRSVVGIKEVKSTSQENFCNVRIEITGQYDLDDVLSEVKNEVDGINSFPVDAERPIVKKQRPTSMALSIYLSGNVNPLTLKAYANQIEDDFLKSGKISQISISGLPEIEISIEVKEQELRRHSITIDNISNAVSMNNRDMTGGIIKSPEEEMLIRLKSRSLNPDKIGNIVVKANSDGSMIRVRDIADVKKKYADVSNEVYEHGKRAVYITVNKLPEEDLEEISDYVNNYKEEFNQKHSDVQIGISFDFIHMLSERLNMLLDNGIIGVLLVFISLALFLNVRLSLWVAWGIPAAFLAMFIFGNIQGITINMISLFGMILVIGILVDDGIVIGENIYAHFEQGKTPSRAAIDGTMEVLPAVVTSISTTIIAFSPLFLVSGHMEFMYEMAFVVVFSLAFSLFEAFFVLPAHLGNGGVLREHEDNSRSQRFRDRIESVINYLRYNIYGKIIKVAIKWRVVFLFIPVFLILVTAGLFGGGFIKATFFPRVAFDMFSVDIAFTAGSGEKQTKDYIFKYDSLIWEVNKELMEEFNDTNTFVENTFASIGNSFRGEEIGSHAGNITVTLRNMDESPISSAAIANRVKDKIGDAPELAQFKVGNVSRWGSPISVRLIGKDQEELTQAKEYLVERFKKHPKLKNVTHNNPLGKQEIHLELLPQAYFLGLNEMAIMNQVRVGFYGSQTQRLLDGRDEIRIWVRYPKEDKLNIGQLENMKIKTPTGVYPLSELASYKIERGPVKIKRQDGFREISVEADMLDDDASAIEISDEIKETIVKEMLMKYPGVSIAKSGQEKGATESQAEIQKYFIPALILILLLLMVHFRSVKQGLIILAMIPLAILAAMWGHGIHDKMVSMLSAWGMVALTGVIINDAVVFQSKYNSLLRDGKTVYQAIYNAGISRFRPILLTTITTTAGLFPLILETSFQAQFLKPMAISLAYGVGIGTFFILLLFPVLLMLLNDVRVLRRWIWTGVKPTREEVEIAVRNMKKEI